MKLGITIGHCDLLFHYCYFYLFFLLKQTATELQMLRTDLNLTRSELQVADADFQKSLSAVNTTLETRVTHMFVIRFNLFHQLVLLLACLFVLFICLLVYLFSFHDNCSLENSISKILVRCRVFNFRFQNKSC